VIKKIEYENKMNYLPQCFSIYCNYLTLEEEEEEEDDFKEEPRNSC